MHLNQCDVMRRAHQILSISSLTDGPDAAQSDSFEAAMWPRSLRYRSCRGASLQATLRTTMIAITGKQKVLGISPEHPKALYRLGQAHTQLGEYTKATAALERAKVCDSARLPPPPKLS
eukprot:scaffold82207_cov31-Tisochrysis_lutea.AAC.7